MQFTVEATVLASMTPHKTGMLSGEGQLNDLLNGYLFQILLLLGSCQPVSVQVPGPLLEESYPPSCSISHSAEGALLGCQPLPV